MNKRIFLLLLTLLCPVAVVAQVNHKGKNTPNLSFQAQLERTLTRAAAARQKPTQGSTCSCCNKSAETSLSPQELIAAEEELALLRNRVDPRATFEKYPYLLDLSYRHTHDSSGKMYPEMIPAKSVPPEPLSTHELIAAEEELSLLRTRTDPNATFDKYPYLLDPTYRRATDAQKQSIRRPYTQSSWARKVGF